MDPWHPARHLDGLQVAPVIPSAWSGFEAVRMFRGVRYHIHVLRHGPGNEIHLSVDGKDIQGTVIPLPPNETSDVEVTATIR